MEEKRKNFSGIYDQAELLRREHALRQIPEIAPVAGSIRDQITKENSSYVERDPALLSGRYNAYSCNIQKQRRHMNRLFQTTP